MKIVEPQVELWKQESTLEGAWHQIARATRVCYQSKPREGESDEAFVNRVILRNGNTEDFTKLHCYTGDVELLTINGWIKFENYNGEQVAVIDSNRNFKGYENPISIQHHNYNGNFYYYPELGIKVTDGHKMFGSFRKNNKSFGQCNDFELFKCNTPYIHNNRIYTYGERQFKTANCCHYNNFIDSMIDKWSELLGFWIGDGCHNDYKNQIIFHLHKLDKINYIHNLAKSLNIYYEDVNDYVKLNFEGIGEKFNKYYNDVTHNKQIINKNYSLKEIAGIIKGLLYSDSDIRTTKNRNTNTIRYSTTSKSVYEWIMSNAPLVGYSVNGTSPIIRDGNRSDIYYIYFKQNDYTIHNDSRKPQSKVIITNENLDVYCVSVSTGIIMVRGSKGISTICGNCAMLEHGTIYLTIPGDIIFNTTVSISKYIVNKYSRVIFIHGNNDYVNDACITTNMRVIIENNWQDDLKFISVPTHHIKRTTFSVITDIGVTRELNRHRRNSIAEQSTRYCTYSSSKFGEEITYSNNDFLAECVLDLDSHFYDLCKDIIDKKDNKLDKWTAEHYYMFGMLAAEFAYLGLKKNKVPNDIARQVLNLNTKSQAVYTAFDDDWEHFIKLRADDVSGKVHPNMKIIADKIKELFNNK